jgi:hypothetical protein
MIEPHETSKRDGVPDLLTVAEAAAALRTGLTFAYESTGRYIAAPNLRDIPAIKVGRHTRVPRVALEEFMGVPITWPIPGLGKPAYAGEQLTASVSVEASRRRSPRHPSSPAASVLRLFES